jgi:prepilin-type N-terminal cleavage/methylation domain-containing protein
MRPVADRSNTRAVGNRSHSGFTLVELLVVIAIIGILVALGVPAFSTIQRNSQYARAEQLLSGLTQRAALLALSNRTPAAVRLCPAAWEQLDDSAGTQVSGPVATGRQVATLYQYKFSGLSPDPTVPNWDKTVAFEERFERVADAPAVLLPTGIWAAPAEAIMSDPYDSDNSDDDLFESPAVLDGTLGKFETDAAGGTSGNEALLDADDFLIVFNPETGLAPSRWPDQSDSAAGHVLRRDAWKLLALRYDETNPSRSFETAYEANDFDAAPNLNQPFRRYNFTGAILYDREAFVELGPNGSDSAVREARLTFLKSNGRLLWARRTGGGLYSPGDAK